jgi:hypothetical protein
MSFEEDVFFLFLEEKRTPFSLRSRSVSETSCLLLPTTVPLLDWRLPPGVRSSYGPVAAIKGGPLLG